MTAKVMIDWADRSAVLSVVLRGKPTGQQWRARRSRDGGMNLQDVVGLEETVLNALLDTEPGTRLILEHPQREGELSSLL